MRLVCDAMNRAPATIAPEATVGEARALAAREGTAHLLVLDAGNLVGILCTCDLRAGPAGEQVCERMSLPVLTVRPDVTVDDAAATLCECRLGCLPVALGGLLLGVVGEEELERAGATRLPRPRHCHRHVQPR